MPDMPDTFVQEITDRYVELYELLTGMPFERPSDTEDVLQRIEQHIIKALS
jgi:phosphoribosylaminoimidazole-succinocarboxamide synthase